MCGHRCAGPDGQGRFCVAGPTVVRYQTCRAGPARLGASDLLACPIPRVRSASGGAPKRLARRGRCRPRAVPPRSSQTAARPPADALKSGRRSTLSTAATVCVVVEHKSRRGHPTHPRTFRASRPCGPQPPPHTRRLSFSIAPPSLQSASAPACPRHHDHPAMHRRGGGRRPPPHRGDHPPRRRRCARGGALDHCLAAAVAQHRLHGRARPP